MRRRARLGAPIALIVTSLAAACATSRPARPRFTFEHGIELFETTSGLRFAVVHDERTTLATIDVRYDVGAAADPPGLGGLAHLIEHLTFELAEAPGTPTLGEELDSLALASNAYTLWDETHYTATVPAGRLARAIALEGRRLRGTCEQLDDARLARERDVVLAEAAERGGPARDLALQVYRLVYGADHPYARVVGSAEVARANRADVCAFMAAHHDPRRAYLVVTGPVAVDEVRRMIGRTFGPIRPRESAPPPVEIPAPDFHGERVRAAAPLRHPTAMVLFPQPAWGTTGRLPYVMAGRLLAAELAGADDEEPWIVGTGTVMLGGPRAPVLAALVEVADAARLESAAEEVFRRVGRLRAYDDYDASPVVSGVVLGEMMRWDDLLGRGDWIADFLQYADHRWFMLEDLRAAAAGWQRHRAEVVEAMAPEHARVVLFDRRAEAAHGTVAGARSPGVHDVAIWRAEVDPAEADRPLALEERPPPLPVRTYELASGLRVMLAPDPASPLVDARLVFPAGIADQQADQPLVALAAAYLLAPPQVVPRFVNRLARSPIRDAVVSDVEVDETSTVFSIHGLAEASGGFVRSLARRIVDGGYDARTIEQIRKAAGEAGDDDEDEVTTDDEAAAEADRRFRERLFGAEHPYGAAAIAYAPALESLDSRELARWKRERYRARGATLVVSGRFDVAAVEREIARSFGGWSGEPPPPRPAVPSPAPAPGPTWAAALDRAANQVSVRLGFPAGTDGDGAGIARRVLAAMVLDVVRDVREGLGASYGLHAHYLGGVAGRALVIEGRIDEERAAAAVPRLLAALDRLRDDAGVRREAFVRARRRVLAEAQVRVAGAIPMADQLVALAGEGGTPGDLERLVDALAALTIADVDRLAASVLARDHLVLELRGRRAPVGAAFAALAVTPAWLSGDGDDDVEEPDDREDAPAEGEDTPAVAVAVPEAPAGPIDPWATPSDGVATSTAPPRTVPEVSPPRPARPAPRTIEPAPITGRLQVGDPESVHGPREPGVYRDGVRISLDEFLRASGHAEIAEEIIDRRRLRIGLVAGGFGVAAASIVYLAVGLEACDDRPGTPQQQACFDRNADRRLPGFAGTVGGALVGLVGLQVATGIPDEARLREYADAHNYRRLRDAHAASPAVTVAPSIGAGGVGITVGGRF